MFKTRAFLAAIGTLVSAAVSHAQSPAGAALDQVLTEVQVALIKVRDAVQDESLPPLQKVTLTLQTSVEKEGGGKLDIVVAEAGASQTSGTTQEITMELAPPNPADKSNVAAIADPLADAIVQAARAAKAASKRNPPLHLVSLVSKVEFTVKRDANAAAGFRLEPVTLGAEGSITSSSIQRATIEYGGVHQ